MNKTGAKALGILDGLRQPTDLDFGFSWKDKEINERYNEGLNIGQAVGRACLRVYDTFRVLSKSGRIQPVE